MGGSRTAPTVANFLGRSLDCSPFFGVKYFILLNSIESHHNAPMNPSISRPIGIDLFSGAGGFSLGFEQAGFDVVAAVEIDPIHAATHHYNFPHCAILPRSVADLSATQIREAAGIGDRPIDVVFGGAPCQGFSLIGKRALDDPRNALVREFLRLVVELEAKYFVFENVKGLTVGNYRQVLDESIEAFDAKGYEVRAPWQVLNAASFGVPQDRHRLILLGGCKGLPLPDYPSPHTRSPGATGAADAALPPCPTCADALGDVPNADEFTELHHRDWVEIEEWGKPSAYARLMRGLDDRAWGYGYQRTWNQKLLSASRRTNHTKTSRERFARTEPGKVEPVSRFFKLSERGVANTLRAGTDSARGAFTSPRPIHYRYPRCVTVREMARLHGFPDWFGFHATKWHGARQIGNAVPPPLARAVASAMLERMGVQPQRPERVLELGTMELLRLDMSQASQHWGIEVPIAPRKRERT
jgi:DNA (cytosine-5)-methyltransferase 1